MIMSQQLKRLPTIIPRNSEVHMDKKNIISLIYLHKHSATSCRQMEITFIFYFIFLGFNIIAVKQYFNKGININDTNIDAIVSEYEIGENNMINL